MLSRMKLCVGMGEKEWSRVSKAVIRLVVESSRNKHTPRCTKIYMYHIFEHKSTGPDRKTFDNARTYTHHRQMWTTWRCTHRDRSFYSHIHTHHHTLLRGPGLHFMAVCPTSSRSASFHFQQRDGKKMDRMERQRKKRIKLLFFSLLQSGDVNKSEEQKKTL